MPRLFNPAVNAPPPAPQNNPPVLLYNHHMFYAPMPVAPLAYRFHYLKQSALGGKSL